MMSIELTERAAEQIRQAMADGGLDPAATALRVALKASQPGQPGAGHVLDLTGTWSEEADVVSESQGVRIVCLRDNHWRLDGTTIDFRDEPDARGFVFKRPGIVRDAAQVQDHPPPGEAEVRQALRSVIDPEVGLNIVDLGLVYGVAVADRQVNLTMTMTTPACPLSEHIKQDARQSVLAQCPGAAAVEIDLVWDPPWASHMMSPEAKQQMGWAKA
jgi:metal-sulfur cluster biosynthetic enzyme/Fe-S cluster assembly iron-binding protein IscA